MILINSIIIKMCIEIASIWNELVPIFKGMFSNLPISIKLFLEIVSSGMMPKSLPSSSKNFKFGDDPIKTTHRDTVNVSKCDVLLVPCKSTSLLASIGKEKINFNFN